MFKSVKIGLMISSLLLVIGIGVKVNAQVFDPSVGVSDEEQTVPVEVEEREVFVPNAPVAPSNLPQPVRPTLDGSKRGQVMMHAVIADANQARQIEEGMIFVFYRDFKINRLMGGSVSCDVQFVVLSTMDRKINNLSFKLKWPEMLTSLSFDDVNPNVETYYNYTLLGQGCYTMDKIPNVVVNRCRVRNMTQQECAQKIRWIKKS